MQANANIISATEANRSFSEILNRVYYQKQIFDIKRGKEIIAKIVPINEKPLSNLKAKDLVSFLNQLPRLEEEEKIALLRHVEEMRKLLPDKDRQWD